MVSSAGHSGAASAPWEDVSTATIFAVTALLSPETPHVPLAGQRSISRLHAAVKSEPVYSDHSAHRRDMRAFQSQAIAKSHTRGFWGAVGPLVQMCVYSSSTHLYKL